MKENRLNFAMKSCIALMKGPKMGPAVICYILFLATDLLVGTGIIIWKCAVSEEESDCKLAIAGTLCSVGIFFVLIIVFPVVLIKFDEYDLMERFKGIFRKVLDNVHKKQSSDIVIQNEVCLPTTPSSRWECLSDIIQTDCKNIRTLLSDAAADKSDTSAKSQIINDTQLKTEGETDKHAMEDNTNSSSKLLGFKPET